jgi:hypothetical protein
MEASIIITLGRLTPTTMPTNEPILKPPGCAEGDGVGRQ